MATPGDIIMPIIVSCVPQIVAVNNEGWEKITKGGGRNSMIR